jgi:hypothetical protein
MGRLASHPDGREQQGHEYPNDRDDDQQLDEGECSPLSRRLRREPAAGKRPP